MPVIDPERTERFTLAADRRRRARVLARARGRGAGLSRAVEPLERNQTWDLGAPPETYPTAL